MLNRRSLLAAGAGLLAPSSPARSQSQPPDIVIVVLDDMRAGDWRALPKTKRLLSSGTWFDDFILTTPQCAPSRATLLTGRYAHNHGTLGNEGWANFRHTEGDTVAVALKAAGYRTGLFGKYMNGFPAGAAAPPGWDHWRGSAEGSYGSRKRYGTDRYFREAAAFAASTPAAKPLFAWVAPKAPHAPPVPAERHASRFRRSQVPRTAALNEADVSDKPDYLRHPRIDMPEMHALYRNRLRTLLAVDEGVVRLAKAMGDRWNRACIVVLSDNGFALGEHRWVGKNTPHDESARVPMLVRCPGLPGGRDRRLAASIDIAPTLATVAGAALPGVDGRSLLDSWDRDRVLIEDWAGAAGAPYKGKYQAPPYQAVRSREALYVEYETGEREHYDLTVDPRQMDNLAAESADPGALPERLDALRRCAGNTCRAADGAG